MTDTPIDCLICAAYQIIMTASPSFPSDPATGQEAVVTALVADRIASLRRERKLSFDALAQRAGVSKGTLVQIEQQRGNPSISTLCRLAAALDVSVADLVAPPEIGAQAVTLVRATEARRLWTGPKGGSAVLLAGTAGPDMLEIWTWVLMPAERFEAAIHGRGTRELLHVTDGSLALEVEGVPHLVNAGTSVIALTDRRHAYSNPGQAPVRFTMTVHEPAQD
jgi:transcriptional regulator with XRE-family HTH domain